MNTTCTASCRSIAAVCLFLCTLGPGFTAGAQEALHATRTTNPKELMMHRPFNPLQGARSADVMRNPASAAEAAPGTSAQEIVLHNFLSPPHGAYPANGVIRDAEGNLNGTTNGSFSDIGGGGANDAGVVFKIDTEGKQTVLYSFTGGADGGTPYAGVALGPEGQLFGTTAFGGRTNVGVVFEIKP